MRILINAVNLKVGGGVTVIANFLECLISHQEFHNDEYLVLAPSGVGYEKWNLPPVQIEIIPETMKSPLRRLWLDYLWLKPRIMAYNPDVVFTMGNIAVPTNGIPQAVLFMYPYAIYPEEIAVWRKLNWRERVDLRMRNFIFKTRLGLSDVIFPQTEVSKKRLLQYYSRRIKQINVIPTAYSKIGEGIVVAPAFDKDPGCKYLLCLSKYYSHKNLEIFIPLAAEIKNRNSNIRILLTISEHQGEGAAKLLKCIEANDLGRILINLGPVPIDHVPALYSRVDGMILPTLLESFSATYIDSLTLGVPVFTSNRDFAHDVCGDAAWYFDPMNEIDIYEIITSAFQNDSDLLKKIEFGKSRASDAYTWLDVSRMYVNSLKLIIV
jgi:glycosyltransferase involved in cell wall biosynthesis